jgi:hypothetical protein
LGDFGSGIFSWALRVSGFDTVWKNLLISIFGADWQAELAKFCAHALMRFFGVTIDPTASGAPLHNDIYVGSDVITNGYMETNIGARQMSQDEDLVQLQKANDHYRQDMAALPLKDRLFALNVPSSLASQFFAAMPANLNPSTIVAGFGDALRALPGAFASLVSRRAAADFTQQQQAGFDGVAQFGGSDAEIDADIAPEVTDPTNPACPANNDNFFNNCQAYKEIISGAMCMYTDCPQFQNN